jgi:hypothetical protein
VAAREVGEPIDHERRALEIGLHREPEPFPALQAAGLEHALEDFERKAEAVGFLGIERDADVALAGPLDQRSHARHELG